MMNATILHHWYLTYILTLFSFNIVPGVSFIATIKNTIEQKSFKAGLCTAIGVATADFIAAILGYFFCATLELHQTAFQYARMVGMMYLLYIGIKIMTSKRTSLADNKISTSSNLLEAYKSGFLYNFSNIGMITITIGIVSQYYKYVSHWYGYFNLVLTIPIVSFSYFTCIAFLCYRFNLWKFFDKHVAIFDKVAGFIIIFLASTNMKSILS